MLRDEVELVSSAGHEFDLGAVLRGELSPVCFGSAITNFGVQSSLDTFTEYAPPPELFTTTDQIVEPTQPEFSGFVFKIQANMISCHRDRVAFLRICSGRYSRDMEVWHSRMKRKVRLAPPFALFGQDREVIEEAYAGDVIGVINPGMFAIGDTVSERDMGEFPPLPRFQPEHFALVRATRSDKYKQFLRGLPDRRGGRDPALLSGIEWPQGAILAAVGARCNSMWCDSAWSLSTPSRRRWSRSPSAPHVGSRVIPRKLPPSPIAAAACVRRIGTAIRCCSSPRRGICATPRRTPRQPVSVPFRLRSAGR